MKKDVTIPLNTTEEERNYYSYFLKKIEKSNKFGYLNSQKCLLFYFNEDGPLYGVSFIDGNALYEHLYIFFKDDAKFEVEYKKDGGTLISKGKTRSHELLEYEDIVELEKLLDD